MEMKLKPSSTVTKEMKLSDINWLGVAHHKSSQDDDPENPPDNKDTAGNHESYGYGYTADSVRRRSSLETNHKDKKSPNK